ncbi:MAG TPA: tetratricopeptide repeat protein [Anaerolineae bacterium]|nr:tetratricopeptide repeat protein [Anaerolineae bacterium]
MIVTFYSYKGGVGRSMALANVAQLFYEQGYKVLMVDWDLEAPGLERFFSNKASDILQHPGLIDILLDYKRNATIGLNNSTKQLLPTPHKYVNLLSSKTENTGELRLLSAGKRNGKHFSQYVQSVVNFNWQDFYQNWEGHRYLEWLRQQLLTMADIVFIDSRTGVTEIGGVCVYQLADIVVMLCAPNQQNLAGTYEMVQSLKNDGLQNMRQKRPLKTLIIPSRIERAESDSLDDFQKQFADLFAESVSATTEISLKDVWDASIPYVPKYAYQEELAVNKLNKESSKEIAEAYSNLSGLIKLMAGLVFSPDGIPVDYIPEVASLPATSRMPFRPNPLFAGRKELLKMIATSFKRHALEQTSMLEIQGIGAIGKTHLAKAKPKTISLTGMGGIGKTQLAIEFAYRYGRYFPGGVFWLNFAKASNVVMEVIACGEEMGISMVATETIQEKAAVVRRIWADGISRLFIFDQCEDERLLTEWLPLTGNCYVLMTSRRGYWSSSSGVVAKSLGALAREESVALLQELAARLTVAEAEQVAEALHDYPLALQLAGAYLDEFVTIPVTTYVERLGRESSLELRSLKEWQGSSPTQYERGVAEAFALSYEQLLAVDGGATNNDVDEMAQQLLWRAALLAPEVVIAGELWRACLVGDEGEDGGQDEFKLEEMFDLAVARLVSLGFVVKNDKGWLMHRLVGVFVRGVMGEVNEGVEGAVAEGVLAQVVGRQDKGGRLGKMSLLAEHLRYVTDEALAVSSRQDGKETELLGRLSAWLGYYLNELPDYPAARYYYERALAIREKVLGEEHPDTAGSFNNMGLLLEKMGEYKTARSYYERALAIREKVLGEEHPDTASSLNNMGEVLERMGEYETARSYYERALAIREKVLGEEHPDTASSLNNMGEVLERMGEYETARSYYERALAITERILGAEHPHTASIVNNMGGLLSSIGDYEAARPYFEKALAITERMLGAEHPSTASIVNNMGGLLSSTGDYEAARSYYERALVIREKVLGGEHPDTARSINDMGFLLSSIGEYEAARPYYERALAIREKVLGGEHPDTASSVNNLGGLLESMGEYEAARPYYERALAIREKVLGGEHPDTASSVNNLGGLLLRMGEYEAARPYFERAVRICEKMLGEKHPTTKILRGNLEYLLSKL